MKKFLFRSGLAAGTLGLVLAGAAAFSAFEAHVVNVTATIAEATEVPTTPIEYGTVFPQEILYKTQNISLSQDFLNSDATSLSYVLKQKPKCARDENNTVDSAPYAQVTEDVDGVTFICPTGYHKMELLCPYLSKTSPNEGDKSIPSFHGPTTLASWNDTVSIATQAEGTLNKQNPSTNWTIDLHAPCFKGQCAQDWPTYVHTANPKANPVDYMADPSLEHKQLGCDLWFEVNGVTRAPQAQ